MKSFSKFLAILLIAVFALSGCAPAVSTPAATSTAEATATATAAPTVAATPTAEATAAATATTAPTTAATGPITVSDGLGGTLTLDKPAQTIISLAPSTSEILFALGAGKQLVARDDFTNYPAEAKALPTIGGTSSKYNTEQIVTYKPDLVIATPIVANETLQTLKSLKINVLYVQNPKTLAEMYDILTMIGKVTGHDSEASTLVASLQATEKKVADAVAKTTTKPVVLYELDGTDPAKPWTSGPGTFIDLLITLAGGQNAGAALKGDWAQISQEDLIVKNPDVIFLGDASYGTTPELVSKRPGWDAIKAVKNNNIVIIDDDTISRPGPRILDGLVALTKAIHPEVADALK